MECENSTYARDGKMESPGGVTTVPARRVCVIHIKMVTQTRAGVKVQGYGPTLPLCPGAGISPNTRRILWTPDRLAGHAGAATRQDEGRVP